MNKKILIVEDELALSQALESKLSSVGYKVYTAKDGAEGMQMAINTHPDLILLDIIMPKMNGLDVLKDIKNRASLIDVPVYVLTNLSEDSSAKVAKELGAQEYLVKSNIKIEELAVKIKNLLGD